MNTPPATLAGLALRARAAAVAAGLQGMAAGLDPIRIEALMRYARDLVMRREATAARCIRETWRQAAKMKHDTPGP